MPIDAFSNPDNMVVQGKLTVQPSNRTGDTGVSLDGGAILTDGLGDMIANKMTLGTSSIDLIVAADGTRILGHNASTGNTQLRSAVNHSVQLQDTNGTNLFTVSSSGIFTDGGAITSDGKGNLTVLSINGQSSYNVMSYGAKGNGTNDDTSAIQSAINAAQNAGGGIIFFPQGTYIISAPLTTNTGSMNFSGVGSGSKIKQSASFSGASLFLCTGSSGKSEIHDLYLLGATNTASGNPAADGIQVSSVNNSVGDWITYNLKIDNMNGWAINFLLGSHGTGYMQFYNIVSGGCVNGMHNQIGGMFCSDIVMNTTGGDCFFFEGGDNVLSNLGADVGNGGSGSCLHLNTGYQYANNLDFGGGTPAGPTILIEPISGNIPSNITLSGAKVTNGGGNGITITAASRLKIIGCDIRSNGGHGIAISDNNGNHAIEISQCIFSKNNSNAGTFYDIENLSTHGRVWITGCQFQHDSTTPTACIDSTSTGVVTNCDFTEVASSYPIFSSNKPSIIRSCPGYNPVGSITPPSVPATTVAQTNNFGVDCTVFIVAAAGGTTAVSIGGNSTGITIAASGNATFRVPAGQTITLTYGAGNAPAWSWFGD